MPSSLGCNELTDFDRFVSPGCAAEEELCDERDNDCDGNVDEDFDLATDPANCGMCGNPCLPPAGASSRCTAGACSSECQTRFGDCDDDPANGCEIALVEGTDCGSPVDHGASRHQSAAVAALATHRNLSYIRPFGTLSSAG